MNGLMPRILCAKTLIRAERESSYGNIALANALHGVENLQPSDAALCTRLFQGVTERRLTLDACIAATAKRPPERLDAEVRCVLRCGIYELLYLSTPHSAAVNLWTETVKRLKKSSASAMVNAVLRGFLRGGACIPLPQDALQAMSVKYSVPVPLLQILLHDYDTEAVTAFLEDAFAVPPVYVRRNPAACTAEQFQQTYPQAEPVPAIPDAYIMKRRSETGGEPELLFRKGKGADYHVQDLASQLCCLAVDPQPGETVLDVCAAPGGKSFTMAWLMQNQGRIFAYDLHRHRVGLIESAAKLLSAACITAQTGDARSTEKPPADRVLCDVPCSGYGVIRRKPEIRYKELADTEKLPEIQYAILEASAKAVRQGGVLVYSTCTLLKRENEDVVRRFLASHPEFQPERPWQDNPALAAYGQEMTTLLPQMLGSDGFFIAKLRRSLSADGA